MEEDDVHFLSDFLARLAASRAVAARAQRAWLSGSARSLPPPSARGREKWRCAAAAAESRKTD